MIKKKYPDLHGACIDNFGRLKKPYIALYEKYGLLNKADSTKELIYNTAKLIEVLKLSDIFEDNIILDNPTEFIEKMDIIINSNYNFDGAVLDPNYNFEMDKNNHIVKTCTIFMNPINLEFDLIYSCIYHEIKHIFDYLIKNVSIPFKELLFRDLTYKYFINLKEYRKYIINIPDEIMNYVSNFLEYIQESESTAYLENINEEFHLILNNPQKIRELLLQGNTYQEIKTKFYYNSYLSGYLLIYSNIEKYLNDMLTIGNFDKINKIYKKEFKEVYNVNNFKSVLKIYLKRIKKVKEQSKKLFNEQYQKSILKQLEIKYGNKKVELK